MLSNKVVHSMTELSVPTSIQVHDMLVEFTKDIESFTFHDKLNGQLKPIYCAVCDGMPKHSNWYQWVEIPYFAKLCNISRCLRFNVKECGYPDRLLDDYKVKNACLSDIILSPGSVIDSSNNKIVVCKTCFIHMEKQSERQCKYRTPPSEAIANGYLIGNTPPELSTLSEIELTLVADVRTYCQSWAFHAGAHKQIKGWHTFYSNRPDRIARNFEELQLAGLKGQIVVVLCGPFTTTQRALTLRKTTVNAKKVIAAFQWLKINNILYKDFKIPDENEIPIPVLLDEST
jgi:hypothetical protein